MKTFILSLAFEPELSLLFGSYIFWGLFNIIFKIIAIATINTITHGITIATTPPADKPFFFL